MEPLNTPSKRALPRLPETRRDHLMRSKAVAIQCDDFRYAVSFFEIIGRE